MCVCEEKLGERIKKKLWSLCLPQEKVAVCNILGLVGNDGGCCKLCMSCVP